MTRASEAHVIVSELTVPIYEHCGTGADTLQRERAFVIYLFLSEGRQYLHIDGWFQDRFPA